MNEKLKILVVDSKEATRRLISEIMAGIPGTEVIDTAANGRITLAKLRQFSVDLILLDLDIPEMQGLDTMKKIGKDWRGTDVVIVTGIVEGHVDEIVGALELGAIDFVPKPVNGNENTIREFRLRLLPLIGLLRSRRSFRKASLGNQDISGDEADMRRGEKTVPNYSDRKFPPSVPSPEKHKLYPVIPSRIEVVAIAVSTGGPNALAKVIPQLPGRLSVPVLIVQHMPRSFTASLASSLNAKSVITVREAVDGEEILPNIAYIAPGGSHMLVRAERIRNHSLIKDVRSVRRCISLNNDPPENSVRPSADVLFRSLPAAYEGNILPVIMTGMGSDGTKGVLEMKRRGCYCLSQTADTCTVYGMPRSVDEAALSDEKVPIEQLAARITSIVQGW
ncbi:chemotaxis-specific protein-glutamate methyltransferase CheB [Desulfobacterales bacterium HSG2]|nr:chemotaxis-specific protein-glutamate methyltransferase CheB [Desulfobacterales bacterium HSG2]